MFRRCVCLFLVVLLLAGCSPKNEAPEWQEQYDLGLRCLSEGNYEEAILAFTAVIEIDPKQISAYTGRAEAYIKSGATGENYRNAIADYETVLSIDDSIPSVWINVANLYEQLEGTEKAIEILNEAMEKTEEHDSIAAALEEKKESASQVQSSTGSNEPSTASNDPESISFSALPQEFIFTSGAGAWMTVLQLEADGSFSGNYHDTDAGDTGASYPNGTMYICDLNGKFTAPEKLDEYTYRMTLEYFETDSITGNTTYRDGVRYISSEPYGMENPGDFYLYLPGKPSSQLPGPCIEWVSFLEQIDDRVPEGLYILYNSGGEHPFIAHGEDTDLETGSDSKNITGIVSDIVDLLNVRSGPGTEYEVVGNLLPNTTVTIHELQHKGMTTWGRLDSGWVSMNYIDFPYDPSAVNEIYAEDFVGLTTGEVIQRLGHDYVMCGADAGSYLFRYVKYPFLYFAFNTYEWTSPSGPEIMGNEEIVVIYLFDNAKFNPYLSADMTKAQLDDAVQRMPDVSHSGTETYYSAMDDSYVFQYTIETGTAGICYEWYMDYGNSPDQQAYMVSIGSILR